MAIIRKYAGTQVPLADLYSPRVAVDEPKWRQRQIRRAFAEMSGRSVVYAIRCADGAIKIGCSENFGNRKRAYGVSIDNILAVIPGTHADEQAIHRRLSAYRARGREYYHATPEIMAFVNDMRRKCGVQPIC